MIKARGQHDGRETVFIGLSFGNLDRFRAEPGDTYILIKKEEMNLPFDLLIFSGETETQMSEQMMKNLTPGAKVHVSERLKQ
jgi:predicted alpha/beta-fold hydrolase